MTNIPRRKLLGLESAIDKHYQVEPKKEIEVSTVGIVRRNVFETYFKRVYAAFLEGYYKKE